MNINKHRILATVTTACLMCSLCTAEASAVQSDIADNNITDQSVQYLDNNYYIGSYTDNINKIREKIRRIDESKQVFPDVTPDSKYFEAASALYDTGIIAGYVDGNFHPDDVIRVRDFVHIIFNIANKEEYTSQLNSGKELREIIMYQADNLKCTEIKTLMMMSGLDSWLFSTDAINIAFKALGVRVFNNALYDAENPDKITQVAVRVAKENGLYNGDKGYITRGEAINIVYGVLKNDFNFKIPEIANRITIEYESDIYDVGEVYLKLEEIPDEILDAFNDDNWTFVIGDDRIDSYNEENSSNAVGLCSVADSKLYVIDGFAVVHEFGHFLQKHTLHPFEIIQLYNEEADMLAGITRGYCKTNSGEYFAEAFNLFIKALSDPDTADKFKENVPKTWEYFNNLYTNHWEIVV